MLVLPAINEADFESVKNRLLQAAKILKSVPEPERWIHIDVADGTFTPNSLWRNPAELPMLKSVISALGIQLEIHLMITGPEAALGAWLKSGADRVVIHYETLEFKDDVMLFGESVCLGFSPETPVEKIISASAYSRQVLILSVPPGRSGQPFAESAISAINVLRAKLPDVTIEVDGGVNLATGKRAKAAGASALVSASYLWQNPDPLSAFKALSNL